MANPSRRRKPRRASRGVAEPERPSEIEPSAAAGVSESTYVDTGTVRGTRERKKIKHKKNWRNAAERRLPRQQRRNVPISRSAAATAPDTRPAPNGQRRRRQDASVETQTGAAGTAHAEPGAETGEIRPRRRACRDSSNAAPTRRRHHNHHHHQFHHR